MEHHIKFFESPDGASIAGARGGRGRPLVMCPMLHTTIETDFANYAAAFPNHEVIAWDRRGMGLSERRSPCAEPEPYLQDAQTVVDGFELDTFAIAGTLTGIVEAASLAADNPERVTHLVLRMPITDFTDWADLPGVAAALAGMEHDWEYFTESFAQFAVGWGNPGAPALAAQLRAVTSRDELGAAFDAFMKLDLVAMLPRIRAATLVEHNPDTYFPDSMSRRVASLIENCELVIHSGSATFVDFSAATEFLAQRNVVESSDPPGPRTILFTDMESSTALTQRLGDDAAQELVGLHDSTVRAALDQHGGREVKHTGDGIMASFGSAVAAVTAAVQMQRELTSRGIGARVGLNAGEPIAQGGDLFGTAVQLAARIADHADAGQVIVSNVVKELCAGKQFTFNALGDVALKGFEEPAALYEVHG